MIAAVKWVWNHKIASLIITAIAAGAGIVGYKKLPEEGRTTVRRVGNIGATVGEKTARSVGGFFALAVKAADESISHEPVSDSDRSNWQPDNSYTPVQSTTGTTGQDSYHAWSNQVDKGQRSLSADYNEFKDIANRLLAHASSGDSWSVDIYINGSVNLETSRRDGPGLTHSAVRGLINCLRYSIDKKLGGAYPQAAFDIVNEILKARDGNFKTGKITTASAPAAPQGTHTLSPQMEALLAKAAAKPGFSRGSSNAA